MEELPKKPSESGEDVKPTDDKEDKEDKETKPEEQPVVANSDGAPTSEQTSELPPEPSAEHSSSEPSSEPITDAFAEPPSVNISEHAPEPALEPAVLAEPVDPLTTTPPDGKPAPGVELERVPIEAALGAGWQQLKSHALLLIAVSILATVVMLAPLVVYAVIRELVYRNLFLLACLFLLLVTVPFLYNIGRIKVSLRLVRGEVFDSDDFVNVAPWLFYYLVMLWCRGILIFLASMFFFIPGVLVSTRLDFAEFFIIDKHQNPFKAMASSWRITENVTMMLIFFSATRFFVEFLGNLALLIGGIPARWMSLCAQAFVYERLCHLSGINEVPIISSTADAKILASEFPTEAAVLPAPVVEQSSSADSSV
jgi:hypothetical protein